MGWLVHILINRVRSIPNKCKQGKLVPYIFTTPQGPLGPPCWKSSLPGHAPW